LNSLTQPQNDFRASAGQGHQASGAKLSHDTVGVTDEDGARGLSIEAVGLLVRLIIGLHVGGTSSSLPDMDSTFFERLQYFIRPKILHI
jgi:hypothetical protein